MRGQPRDAYRSDRPDVDNTDGVNTGPYVGHKGPIPDLSYKDRQSGNFKMWCCYISLVKLIRIFHACTLRCQVINLVLCSIIRFLKDMSLGN